PVGQGQAVQHRGVVGEVAGAGQRLELFDRLLVVALVALRQAEGQAEAGVAGLGAVAELLQVLAGAVGGGGGVLRVVRLAGAGQQQLRLLVRRRRGGERGGEGEQGERQRQARPEAGAGVGHRGASRRWGPRPGRRRSGGRWTTGRSRKFRATVRT